MRVDPLLLLAIAALAGALGVCQPVALGAGTGAVVVLLWRRAPRGLWVAAAVVLAAGYLRAQRVVDEFEDRRIAARDAIGRPGRCAGVARVESSPTVRGDVAVYDVAFRHLECEGAAIPAPAFVRLYGGPTDLGRGALVHAVAQLAPIRFFRNAELGDPTPGAARRGAVLSGSVLALEVWSAGRGLAAHVDRARAHARERIEATFAPDARPMARALVLGENDLDPDDDQAFRSSGLAHLLAVSGTHLVFAVVALVRALTFLLVRIERLAQSVDVARLAAGAGAGLALLYADFAGGSGSAWRAAFMLASAFGVRAAGRRLVASRSLAASLGIGAALDPLAVFDLSFLLSAAATVGLIAIGSPLTARLTARASRPVRLVVSALIATIASMIPCAALLALLGPSLTLAGVLANVVAMPFGEAVALPLCLLHPVLTPMPWIENGAAAVGSGALLVVKRLAHASAEATWLAFEVPRPGPWHFLVLIVGAVGLWDGLRGGGAAAFWRRRWACAAWALATLSGLTTVEWAAIRHGRPEGILRVTALDVGQGDATLVDLPDGTLMLVDGGGFVGSPVDPGQSVLLPVLRSRRRDRVDIAVLSHPHPDHFTGLRSALAGVEVGVLWDTGQGEAEGAGPLYAALLEDLRARGVPVLRPDALCGPARPAGPLGPGDFGGARVRVLGPCPTFTPRINANDNSLVVHIAYGRRAVLLTGDAEREQEAHLVAEYGAALRADLLKVGHHGSRTSTSPDLLRAVKPQVATLSCGVRNRFGHPHPVTLSALDAARVAAFRLDRTGSVQWWTDGAAYGVRAFSVAR